MAKDYSIQVTVNGRDNASPVIEKFGKTAQRWMKAAAIAAIAAATAFGTMSMKWGMDFEAEMSNVAAVSRATASEMAALSEKAKQLGRDSAYSATESGQAMAYLAMAGFGVNDILASVGDTLNLAAAGSLDLAEPADTASNVLTGFNLKADQMGRVADVMAEAAAASNTSVRQLGEAMAYVAPQAAAAGWSLEQTVAAVGMLGNAGIQGSMAGTVLRQAIVQLLDPTDEAVFAMRRLGLSIVDGNNRMLSLKDILAQIDPAVLDTADGLAYLTKIFGTRATPGIIALVKQGTDNLGAFTTQLENASGAAADMATTKLDNLKGAFTLLKSSLEGVGIALVTGGENSLAGGMKRFISDSLIPLVNKTSEWIEQVGGLPGFSSWRGSCFCLCHQDQGRFQTAGRLEYIQLVCDSLRGSSFRYRATHSGFFRSNAARHQRCGRCYLASLHSTVFGDDFADNGESH
jgi:TP901 family phage tail tape measure protein